MKNSEFNIAELKETATRILSNNRLHLLNYHPFVGNIAMKMNLVPIRDCRCDSAMTDGKNIFFDIDFLSNLSEDEAVFVLGHEIWHVVMMHFLRGENKNLEIFNIATDMEVNQLLTSDGFVAPNDALFPNNQFNKKSIYDFPSNLSAEEYYDLLLKNQNNFNNEEKNNDSKNSKNSKKRLSGQFDEHFDKNTNYENKECDSCFDKYGEKGYDSDFSPMNVNTENKEREIAEEIRQNVISSAQTVERTRGTLPGNIKKIVDSLLESNMSWKEILAKFITSGFENKTSWNAPNRRFAWNGTYLPRHDGDMMKIAIGVDTSASCGNDLEKFVSEIECIAKSFGSYELHVIQCDTEVKDYQVFDEYNTFNHKNIEFKGFGGTALKPIFDYIDLNDIDVNAVVVFTDGKCESFDENSNINIPILWTITGSNECKNLKIGEKVYMK